MSTDRTAASKQVRDLLEAFVTGPHAPRFSDFAKRHYGEGLAEGEAIGERNTIRMVLKARRFHPHSGTTLTVISAAVSPSRAVPTA